MPKLQLKIPIINGCGTGSYLGIFDRLEQQGAEFGAYLIKSIGPRARDPKYGWEKEKTGNPNPTVIHTGDVMLNSMALPTHPVESWIEELQSSKLKTPIIGSVWGEKPEDYATLIGLVDKYVAAWQVNVSCPNKEQGEKSLMESMTAQVSPIFQPLRNVTDRPITAKLSPNEDYVSGAKAVAPFVDYICCGNTVGPGLVIDIYSKRPVLAGKYGGMSGPAMKPKIMKMVNDVYEAVKGTDVEIIASGRIQSWGDIIEYAIAGASFFEVGTAAFTTLEDGRLRGKTTDEIVQFTKYLNEGVQEFLADQDTTLDKLVGTLQ